MTLAEELKWRNFIQDTTLEDLTRLNQTNWRFYIGFDASASSQTIGNLASMMVALTFLRHNHQAIILAGGATSLIGDPGGKQKERDLQNKEIIASNIVKAQEQFQTVFRDYETQITYVNNLDWFADFKLLDFLRDIGKKFSMTPLIQRDYIASRLGQDGSGISYAEFSYTLLQGYDYLKLFENYGCNLQIGGSDQWGNCISGVDLIRRKHHKTVDVITLPLIINKATGQKFGKSEEQTIWLDANLTHPSDFYQFWLNTADEDVIDYLKIFTPLNKSGIDQIKTKHHQNMALRHAQIKLAESVTTLVHGQKHLNTCQLFSQLAFKSQSDFNDQQIQQILNQVDENSTIEIHQPNSNPDTNNQVIDQLFQEIINKIPNLESKTQMKKLFNNRAIKVVLINGPETPKMTWQNYTLNDICDQNLWPTDSMTIGLIVIGKNTMRPVKYIKNN